MKKILLSLLLSVLSLSAIAQNLEFGVKGGVNFVKTNIPSQYKDDPLVSGKTLTTFSVAAFMDFKFGNFSYQPAVSFTGKGRQVFYKGQEADGIDVTEKNNLYYLQVPMNIIYRLPITMGNLYAGVGPYVAVGLLGKTKYITSATTETHNIKFGNNETDIKSTDFGADIIAGLKLKNGLLIGLNYDLGLTNISNNKGDNIKNRVLGVSAGFVF
jgi:hypothetical protein